MSVIIRFEVDNEYLEALGNHYGKRRATRADVKDHINALVDGDATDLMADLEGARARGE